MHAMQLRRLGESLMPTDMPDPEPGPGQMRVRVSACGVCRTDLHVVDGELPDPKLPIIPGHVPIGSLTIHTPTSSGSTSILNPRSRHMLIIVVFSRST